MLNVELQKYYSELKIKVISNKNKIDELKKDSYENIDKSLYNSYLIKTKIIMITTPSGVVILFKL